jgi:hypothetical protein
MRQADHRAVPGSGAQDEPVGARRAGEGGRASVLRDGTRVRRAPDVEPAGPARQRAGAAGFSADMASGRVPGPGRPPVAGAGGTDGMDVPFPAAGMGGTGAPFMTGGAGRGPGTAPARGGVVRSTRSGRPARGAASAAGRGGRG